MEPVLLRLPRVDPPEDGPPFVLLHVSSDGTEPLDLKLIGTENTAVFSVSLKHDQILKFKAKTFNQDQWENVLSVILLSGPRGGQEMEGVEAVAKVEDNAISILIQRRIEGITQRLGKIPLPANETDAEEVDIFEWCDLAIKEKDTASLELDGLRATLETKDNQIKKLEDSLAELVKLKNENETQLLEKFSLLLNEKKLKIRDQQRLLACSNVDPEKLARVEENRTTNESRSHSAGPSRKGKRKADQHNESDESDSGFEKMEVDKPADDSEHEQAQTPDESTADEDGSDDELPTLPERRSGSNTKKGKEIVKDTTPAPGAAAPTASLPPKRELPFFRKPSAAPTKSEPPAAASAPMVEGSDTESDDEL